MIPIIVIVIIIIVILVPILLGIYGYYSGKTKFNSKQSEGLNNTLFANENVYNPFAAKTKNKYCEMHSTKTKKLAGCP